MLLALLLGPLVPGLVPSPVRAADAPADPVVAERGTTTLTLGALRQMLDALDPEERHRLTQDPAALAQFVRGRLVQMALLDEAHAQQWDQRPEIAARAEQARQAAIVDSYVASQTRPDPGFPSEAEVQAAYEANKPRFAVPRQYHLAQIFIALPAGAPQAAEDAAQKKLTELRQALARPHADFAELARKQSEDRGSGAQGGDLGWVREDQLLPGIRAAVSGLSEGAVSDPVRTPDGWHLIRLAGTRPAGTAPLAEVRDSVVAALRQDHQTQAVRAYLATMLRQTPIQINEIALGQMGGK